MTLLLVALVLIILIKTHWFSDILHKPFVFITMEDIKQMVEDVELDKIDEREEGEIWADEIIDAWEEQDAH